MLPSLISSFSDSSIVNFKQYKEFGFLLTRSGEVLENKILNKIKQLQGSIYSGEQMILIGERGIGKTTTLFFIHDILVKNNIKSFIVQRFFVDAGLWQFKF